LSLDPKYQELVVSYLHRSLGVAPAKVHPEVVLFAVKSPDMNDRSKARVLRGSYKVLVEVIAFEKGTEISPRIYIYGNSYGLAGTDAFRRDLMVGLMWGAPVALAFGTIAAVVTVFLQVVIGAAGTCMGRGSTSLFRGQPISC
jgi:peptide/nickel transport system permease protein